MRAIHHELAKLIEDGAIDAIVRPLKSGKEADLFIVEHADERCVAKVYKERNLRSFKNDAGYREGRKVRDTRSQRALDKGSKYGQRLAEKGWHSAEADALRSLEAAGASVPRIFGLYDRVLVMELIADESGHPAPQLAQVAFTPEGAIAIYEAILQQVVFMLLNDLVHGDLSPYNVLVRDDKPVLIDMPQCISAAHNQQAGLLLERDVQAISQFLGLVAPEIRDMGAAAWQLWEEYERGTLNTAFRPDPSRKREGRVDDLEGLAAFVKDAAAEGALERRISQGDAGARAQLHAADRHAADRNSADRNSADRNSADRNAADGHSIPRPHHRPKPRRSGRRR